VHIFINPFLELQKEKKRNEKKMYVVKRTGARQSVHFDKITARIRRLCYGLDTDHVIPEHVAQKVIVGLYAGISTTQLDTLASETAAYMTTIHPDYANLAARIAVSNLHKNTDKSFSKTIERMYTYKNPKTGDDAPLVSDRLYAVVQAHGQELDAAVVHDRDFSYDFFGFKTLERSYLLKCDGEIVERPQHMLMRVAVGIHFEDIARAIETYNMMSEKWFTHASPTLFNAGTPHPQMSSCFLVAMKDDSIEGIYDTLKECAQISKSAGGIGMHMSCIRASGSYIRGTNGTSNGIVPMLRVFNDTARYVDQGGGKRKGAFAVYIEPWHSDIEAFLDLKKNTGKEEMRARDLFYALWIPDLFMKRVESNGKWSLMCPVACPGLQDVHSDEFETLYTRYETEGRFVKQLNAQDLFFKIIDSQIETGTPYMLYKDSANRKSNQQNLGTIKCSNLCTEIIEYSSPDETAVCNLASISLPKFATSDGKFDHDALHRVTKVATFNLNRVIDGNYYPVEAARKSNMRHRPIGLGVQGLADVFIMLRMPFDSPEAKQLNIEIFETIYFAAVTASMELAQVEGPYATFNGSPMSRGIFQFDMWEGGKDKCTGRWDWDALRASVVKHGVRNSLLVAPMPTASTSQILGNNECFEPYTSNIYVRRVLAGEFAVVNTHLLRELVVHGLWTDDIKNQLVANNGSVQAIETIPADIRKLYKTVWEIKMRDIIDMAADRAVFIDQSMSLNLFLATPTHAQLSSMHTYCWKKGLKTGMYYLRTKPAASAIKFTVDQQALASAVAAMGSASRPRQPSETHDRASQAPGTPVGSGGPITPVPSDGSLLTPSPTDEEQVAACRRNAETGETECFMCSG